MISVKEILDKLPKEKKAQLMYAFEHGLTQFVEFDKGSFIGVNTERLKHLVPDVKVGTWAVGKIKWL